MDKTLSSWSGIGARIEIKIKEGDGKTRFVRRTVSSGGSFGGNPLRLEIGLGAATAINRVTVRWPVSGKSQSWTELEIDRCYRLEESSAEILEIVLKPVSFGGKQVHEFKAEHH